MKPLTSSQIAGAVSGRLLQGSGDEIISSVCIDTRKLQEDDMFIALQGDRHDGHNFLQEAVEKGASALLVSREDVDISSSLPIILTGNTTEALQDLARFHRQCFPELTVVAITGSVGKTTTKDMLAGILSREYQVLKTSGNLNNHIGVPLTLLELEGDEDFAVLELGMSSIGEIRLLSRISMPDIGIITNVGPSHLEDLGDVESVALGKRELVEELPAAGTAVLNYDNKHVRRMAAHFDGSVIFYGFNLDADIGVKKIDEQEGGSRFWLDYRGEEVELFLTKPGRHNVYNALAALAVGREFNIDWQQIQEGLNQAEYSDLRLDIFATAGIKIINDTYNANPLSVRAALNVLIGTGAERRIAVLGDMLELGDFAEKAHRQVGEDIAELDLDFLFCVGKLSRYIARGAVDAGMEGERVYTASGNQETINLLKNIVNTGDVVLIKGSRGMEMEEIVAGLEEWGG
ncbi:MAG: UDP-N-acetylmuramoyl-tripeptide--D-alanyl-D-alanine ligase [Halanaerobiaceae bacterium]